MNELELKTELKIMMLWIKSLAAESAFGKCACGAIFGMADQGLRTPERKALISREAPDWLKNEFPYYDFVNAKLKEDNG